METTRHGYVSTRTRDPSYDQRRSLQLVLNFDDARGLPLVTMGHARWRRRRIPMRGKRLGGFARRDRPFAERHLSRLMPCAAPTCGHMPHLPVTFHRHRERPRRLRSALSELTCRSMESSVLPAPQGASTARSWPGTTACSRRRRYLCSDRGGPAPKPVSFRWSGCRR
jgi:hypothetical protein